MDGLISLAGFGVGMLVGMTGVGGGALMTPLLIMLFQVPPMVAVGTDLLFAALTKLFGGMAHARGGAVDWRLVGLLAAGSVPVTLFSLLFLSELQQSGAAEALIRSTVGVALLATAVFMLFRARIINGLLAYCPRFLKRYRPLLTVLAGGLIGYLVTLSSIGAGAIGIVFISLLYPHMRSVRVVGSDIVHAVPLTTLAGAGHYFLGSVDVSLLALLLLGSLPGILLGSRVGHYLPDKTLRMLLAGAIALASIKLLA